MEREWSDLRILVVDAVRRYEAVGFVSKPVEWVSRSKNDDG
jgi:hypothetical protein